MVIPETLVVDANILFSFFKRGSSRAVVIEKLFYKGIKLISPDFVFEELYKNRSKIKRFCGIDDSEFRFMLSLLERVIEPIPKQEYRSFLPEANKISPHGEETKDDPYFALALFSSCPIWSDEEDFKNQSRVETLNTKELLKKLGLI